MERARVKKEQRKRGRRRNAFINVFYADGTQCMIATHRGFGWTHHAAAEGKALDVVKTLEGNEAKTLGVRINVRDSSGRTSFEQAATKGNTTLMELILCLVECVPFVPSAPGLLCGDAANEFCDRYKGLAPSGYVQIPKTVCLTYLSFSDFLTHGLFA